jgi:hypothetical protein
VCRRTWRRWSRPALRPAASRCCCSRDGHRQLDAAMQSTATPSSTR